MTSLTDRIQTLWTKIQQTPRQLPTRIAIPPHHTDRGTTGEPFQPNTHYFQVRVNEMYLTQSRKWFDEYDPLVFFVSEFIYDKQIETVPFLLGPSLMEKYGQKIPNGTIFANTRVAGLHPYQGGKLTFSLILCQVKRTETLQKLLKIVENTASAIDFSTALNTYIKVAGILLDGFETLLGLDKTQPLIALRQEFDRSAGDELKPGFFALIDKPESELDRDRFWVRENQLLYGADITTAHPFREADYLLYSLMQTRDREDDNILPFYPLYEQAKEAAAKPDEGSWKAAKATLLTLYQTLINSPDLTLKQAQKLIDCYVTEVKDIHDTAIGLGILGSEEFAIGELDELDREANRDRGLAILEL